MKIDDLLHFNDYFDFCPINLIKINFFILFFLFSLIILFFNFFLNKFQNITLRKMIKIIFLLQLIDFT